MSLGDFGVTILLSTATARHLRAHSAGYQLSFTAGADESREESVRSDSRILLEYLRSPFVKALGAHGMLAMM